jgi:hypothetical protein
MSFDESTDARWRAAAVATGPAVLLAAMLYHPFVAVPPRDVDAIAAAVTGDPVRWGLAHLATAVGSALLILSFLAVRHALREVGEHRFSTWGFVFVALGSTLYAFLPGLEFAPLAAAETGGDVRAAQEALTPWFIPVVATSAFLFAIGVLGFCRGLADSRLLSPTTTRVVITALAVMALARFVPLGVAQFHLQGLAGVVALWPVALHLWRQASPQPTGAARPSPAA